MQADDTTQNVTVLYVVTLWGIPPVCPLGKLAITKINSWKYKFNNPSFLFYIFPQISFAVRFIKQ